VGFKTIKMSNLKKINFPNKICVKQAEIVGIMFGDGNMQNRHNNTHIIRIFLNSTKDENYSKHIKKLFKECFDIPLKALVREKKSELTVYYYSKLLVKYFNKVLKVPLSPKILSEIPSYIKNYEEFLKAFIRGLFDTDGCVVNQRFNKYQYQIIKICTKHYLFAKEIVFCLNKLGIKSNISRKCNKRGEVGYDIYLNQTQGKIFFKIIGSNNQRNKNKWGHWDSNPNLVVSSSKRQTIC